MPTKCILPSHPYGCYCTIHRLLVPSNLEMNDQLPTPLYEILILNLYLGSIIYLSGLTFIAIVLRINRKLTFLRFFTNALIYLAVANCLSMIVWIYWIIPYDIMIGPINLPATIASILVLTPLLLIQKLKFSR